jgi:predicted transcriptional regulator
MGKPVLRVLQPQEVEVYYLLPAVRRELALALKDEGSDQKAIADLLHLTPAAVSQYINGKRGREIQLPSAFIARIKASARKVKDDASCYAALQRLLKDANDSRVLCTIHQRMDKTLPQDCALCFAR